MQLAMGDDKPIVDDDPWALPDLQPTGKPWAGEWRGLCSVQRWAGRDAHESSLYRSARNVCMKETAEAKHIG